MLFIVARHKARLGLIALAVFLCIMSGCGSRSRDIVGKWRTSRDANAMVWEFSPNGAVLIGSDKGRYSFGDQNRVKIETPFAKSVYQIEVSGDRMTLRQPNGSKLEFTKIK
jgi:outer membrane biogenesis lipoprotein LolB